MASPSALVPFALLDDSSSAAAGPASDSNRRSRLYTGFVREHICTNPDSLDALNTAVAEGLATGLHAVVLADYEWGTALADITSLPGSTASAHSSHPTQLPPALRCLMFSTLVFLSHEETGRWLADQDNQDAEPSCAGVLDTHASITQTEFDTALNQVDAALRAGDAYQINYTFRLDFTAFGTPLALYRRLRARQPVRYGALIALPDTRWVLSCSPELFVAFDSASAEITARPMKGTAACVRDPIENEQVAQTLRNDPKNRAENVMIVDLLRNDLGRIAITGSVRVPELFQLEQHPTVWQMTSTVNAKLNASTTFADILRALFPCGSITGAPKHRVMQLIAAIESTPRGLYTGAIGWLDAPAQQKERGAASSTLTRCGDFCLSVAIRTLVLQPLPVNSHPKHEDDTCAAHNPYAGPFAGRLGIGAGIVLDSQTADEYQECYLKARFLTELDPGLVLFETLHASHTSKVRYLERHLARLAASAQRLGFRCAIEQARLLIQQRLAQLPTTGEFRLRLTLNRQGDFTLTHAPLAPFPDKPVKILLAQELGFVPTSASDPLLALKTSRRNQYDQAWQKAETLGAFDAIFTNTQGELTEGGRSNLLVKLDGRWWTPPLASGVLPGVMRSVLLEDAQWNAAQRVLTPGDLRAAEAIVVCNALRGVLAARLT